MKKQNALLTLLFIPLLLAGCNPITTTTTSESESSFETSSDVITSTSLPKETIDGMLDFWVINDYHGRIVANESLNEPGLAKLATFLHYKEAENYGNFVFLSSGDTFQDTYDSGTNQGELIAKTLPMLNCEAMAVGNHEFDWGIDILKRNAEFAGDCAFLGANVYHYDEENNTVSDFASELVDKYKVIERNGVKIGIIGIIGEDQITSITSTIWEGYTFVEPTEIVKQCSDELRIDYGCDVVVVNAHASYSDLGYQFVNGVTSVSQNSNERYVDAVFTAHSHGFDFKTSNGVSFIQSGSHGEYISHVRLDVSEETPKLETMESVFIGNNYTEDAQIKSFIDTYFDEDFYRVKNEVIGTIEGATYLTSTMSGRMLAWMSYELMKDDVSNIDVVINNGGRSSINLSEDGEITRGLIFDALPFQNKTYVTQVKGADILRNTSSYPYYAPNPITINSDEYYTVACIDYVLFHKDSNRNYDKFPSFNGEYSYVEERVSATLIEDYFVINPIISFEDLSSQPGFNNISR